VSPHGLLEIISYSVIIITVNERNKIIGLVGPSGVGKGYCKDAIMANSPDLFSEPVVITTRPKRETDGVDRKAGVSFEEFMAMRTDETMIFAHQPFGPGTHWYGFLSKSLEGDENRVILTEVHIDNVEPFKERFCNSVKLIALVAGRDYLAKNLAARNTESDEEVQLRLEKSLREVELIQGLSKENLLDAIIEVNDDNREKLDTLVIEVIESL